MPEFVQTLINAIEVGSVYALIALGYTMVYGILKFINFAHSDIVALGAWTSFTLATFLLKHIPTPVGMAPPLWVPIAVLLGAMIVCGFLGFVIQRLAYKPLRRAPRLNVLITAIGVSLLLQNVGQLPYVFGASPEAMPRLFRNKTLFSISFGDAAGDTVNISVVDLLIFSTALVLMGVLEFLVFRTRLGRAMRAISYDTDAASLMGVPVDRVISFTFVLGSALAAAAGFLYVLRYPTVRHPGEAVWVLLGLRAFVAAVVGGIGNVRGALLGGYTIAFVEEFGSAYVSGAFRDVYVFAILILILLVKPTGLLGSPLQEKV
jgi:branched-chain amino acid transport system permease protein